MANLRGRVALVTGSSRGIGRAIAREFASREARVIINYVERHSAASQLLSELETVGGRAEVVRADVSNRSEVTALIQSTLTRFGQIDILINNAGITCDRTLKNMSFEEWDRVIEVDLDGVFNCTRLVAPHMIDRRQGSIVNVASIIGQTGAIGQSNYSAAKAGVIGFTKACALELAQYGITVNAVCPGFVETEMLAAVPPEIRESIRQRIPLGRFGAPEEIATCIRFLVTEGKYITGQCVNINGGLFM